MRTLQVRFLLVLALVGILPVGLVGLGVATLDHRTLVRESSRELTGLARGLAGDLEVYVSGLFKDTRAIASLPEIVSMDPARQAALLQSLSPHYPGFTSIASFDDRGQRLAITNHGAPQAITWTYSFARAMRDGRQTWRVDVRQDTWSPAFFITTPIRDHEQQVVGVLSTMTDLKDLSAVVEELPVGDGGQAFVLDPRGRVLLHHDRAAVEERRQHAGLRFLTGEPLAGPGTVRYETGGAASMAGYVPVPGLGWIVVVERPEANVLAPSRRSWLLALGGLAGSMCLALVAAIFLARSMTRPVRELAAAARAFGTGDTTAPLPASASHGSELGTLVEAFVAMRQAVAPREEALRDSEMRFRSITQSAGDAIISADGRGTIIAWNSDAQAHFGYTEAEAIGQPLTRLIPERYREAHGRGLERMRTIGEPHIIGKVVELHGLHRDGSEFPLEISLSTWKAGGETFYTGILRDITERKQAEQMESDFVSFVTHQLRTPLAGIKWMLELAIQNPDLPEEAGSFLQDAQVSADRLIGLVNDLLNVSRLESGRLSVVPEEVRLGELTQSVVDELSPLVREKGHQLTLSGADALPAVLVDPQLLRQVILNLVSNAIKYTPQAGHITIRTGEERGNVSWSIQDNGIGIPKGAQRHLFEKFYRAENVLTVETEGTGLGLYLVRLIVERCGGRVWVESEEGKGATFDEHGIIQSLNRSAERLFACPRRDVIGRPLNSFLAQETPDLFADLGQTLASQAGRALTLRREVTVRRSDGTTVYLDLAISAIPHRTRLLFIGVARDITERKQTEQMKADFVAFTSHQLRTPLSGIQWLLELAAQGPGVPEDTQSYIHDALAASWRLTRLVEDLVHISQLEAGRRPMAHEARDLGRLTQAVLDELAPRLAEKGHRLTVHGAQALPPVVADPVLLRQVIASLLTNAITYTLPGGDIVIRMSQEGGRVQWTIQDNGIGIPDTARRRVFEKFYRAENVFTLETEGTGLGLYLARLILQRFGGQVWCESEEGKGSTFSFTLPLPG